VLTRRGLPRHLPAELHAWDGSPLPPEIEARIRREWRRLVFVRREVLALIRERRGRLRANDSTDPTLPIVRKLLRMGSLVPARDTHGVVTDRSECSRRDRLGTTLDRRQHCFWL
jgi:hypothetical protein